MTIRPCPGCGATVGAQDRFCLQCGETFPSAPDATSTAAAPSPLPGDAPTAVTEAVGAPVDRLSPPTAVTGAIAPVWDSTPPPAPDGGAPQQPGAQLPAPGTVGGGPTWTDGDLGDPGWGPPASPGGPGGSGWGGPGGPGGSGWGGPGGPAGSGGPGGQPPPDRPNDSKRLAVIAVAIVLAVAVAVFAAVKLTDGGGGGTQVATDSSSTGPSGPQIGDTTPTMPGQTTTTIDPNVTTTTGKQIEDGPGPDGPGTTTTAPAVTTTAQTVDDETVAKAELDALVASGRGRVDGEFPDQWVPQLASRRLGLTDATSGKTFSTYRSIVDDFEATGARYGDVILLWSGDFSTFSTKDLYVVVAAQPSPDPADPNAWCDAQGIGVDDCFAKLLSHTSPPDGATVHR